MQQLHVIDSHTPGEPTRLVLAGAPDLGRGIVAAQLTVLRSRFDTWRQGVVSEPRGADALVGVLLCPPGGPSCCAGVIFFNHVA